MMMGIGPGILSFAALVYVQPRVGNLDVSPYTWATVALVAISILGYLRSVKWWRIGERKYLERKSRLGS
jgi:hypothetical protein